MLVASLRADQRTAKRYKLAITKSSRLVDKAIIDTCSGGRLLPHLSGYMWLGLFIWLCLVL